MIEIISESEEKTAALAAETAQNLKPGDLVLLHGTLGSGKTTFARALIRALSDAPDLEVPSPTFTLVQTYDSPAGEIWHFDLYRLKNAEEIYELGWEEAMAAGIILMEWPERLGTLLPPAKLDIRFSSIENRPDSRLIQVTESR